MNRASSLTLLLAASLVIGGCDNMKKDQGASRSDRSDSSSSSSSSSSMRTQMNATAPAKMAVANIKPSRAATTQPTANNVMGTVTFAQQADNVKVTINLSGLPANSTHGIHIHEKGDMSTPDLMSVGAHFNPQG